MLTINNLQKHYLNGKTALRGVNLEIGPGEIVGLFGENGAGKTTLMKSILNFLPYTGSITLDGEPITHRNISRLSFATCEHSFFPTLTAEGHREFYEAHFPNFRRQRFDALMEFFNLPRHRCIGSFSTGQQNQFEVILSVSQGAEYILMDEPFAGNDVFNREDFYKVLLGILDPNETILLSTHLIEEVEPIISRAVLLHEGTIIGDQTISQLEQHNLSLMQYVKQSYHYRSDRVGKTLNLLIEKEE